MIVDRLTVRLFRNITSADINVNPQVNIIFGANGSGKTSVLEALSLLAHGKSFRSHLSSPLIKHGNKSSVVFGSLIDIESGHSLPVGVEKHISKGTSIRINRTRAKTTSELARLLPLLVVDGSAFSVIDGSSKYRRKLLDWLMFHVEPQFHNVWLGYYGALKQRNALLRRGIMGGQEFSIWNQKCVDYGIALTDLRIATFQRFSIELRQILSSLSIETEFSFHPGWKQEIPLDAVLEEQLSGDVQRQTTRVGPHRADIVFRCDAGKVSEVFSRGQKKTTILAIYLAIVAEFVRVNKERPVLALDDLPAELDQSHISDLLAQLLSRAQQLFITAINKEQVLNLLPANVNKTVFHVEQGHVKEIETL